MKKYTSIKVIKKILISFFLLISMNGFTQNSFIKLVNGENMRVKISKFSKNGITYQSGETEIQVDAEQISFIELETEGLKYFNYDTLANNKDTSLLRTLAKQSPFTLLDKGRSVYIPISSSRYKETLGRFDLRNVIDTIGMWNLVYTPYESDFILEYYWKENKCWLEFKDRDGNVIYNSVKVLSNRSMNPSIESKNNIIMLNDIVIRQLKIDLYTKDIISENLIKESKENPFNLLRKGRKVFCKYKDTDKVSYFGCLFFKHFIDKSEYWQAVSSEKGAEFILTFVYDEDGRDHCYFLLSDRNGNIFYQSNSTKADGEDQVFTTNQIGNIALVTYANSWFKNWEPTERSFLSAKILFEKQMPILHKILFKKGINNFKFDFSIK